jgi:hypothetical protein
MDEYDKRLGKRIGKGVDAVLNDRSQLFAWHATRLGRMPEDRVIAGLCFWVKLWSDELDLTEMLARNNLPGDPNAILDAVWDDDVEALKAYAGGSRGMLCAHTLVLIARIREARERTTFEVEPR